MKLSRGGPWVCKQHQEGHPTLLTGPGSCKTHFLPDRPCRVMGQGPSWRLGLNLADTLFFLTQSALAGPDHLSGFAPLPACCRFSGGFLCDCHRNARLSRDVVLGASGFVPYYRSPEERLHTSPVSSSSVLGNSRD